VKGSIPAKYRCTLHEILTTRWNEGESAVACIAVEEMGTKLLYNHKYERKVQHLRTNCVYDGSKMNLSGII
jgi:hypothetical protein